MNESWKTLGKWLLVSNKLMVHRVYNQSYNSKHSQPEDEGLNW